MNRRRKQALLLLALGGLLVALALLLQTGSTPVMAQGGGEGDPASADYCLVCHSDPDPATLTLPDGVVLDLHVDASVLAASVHGTANPDGPVACAGCHGERTFPHTTPIAPGYRAYRIEQTTGCVNCHTDQVAGLAHDVHFEALVAGSVRAPTCVDCHGGHDIQPLSEPIAIANTCGSCHVTVFEEYRQSVHGVALFEGDPNVPTCIDCHGVHGIENPTTAQFRNRSPEQCATCHADTALMEEYGISTYVFDSYLTDFHGSTVSLFEQQAPNVATNKAVCYDCHGVHDIAPADNNSATSLVIRENLLAACRQCHPNATADFPDAWVGHFQPTPESHPLLFIINSFYALLIPVTIAGFALLIGTDLVRRARERSGGGRRRSGEE